MSFCNSFLCYYVLMNLNSVIIKNILSFYKGGNINAANVLFNKSENQIVNYKAINPQTSSNCGENFSGAQILINSCLNSFFFKQKFCWKEGIGLMNIFNFRFFDESTKNIAVRPDEILPPDFLKLHVSVNSLIFRLRKSWDFGKSMKISINIGNIG